MEAFLASFGMVAIAEMGDKTQLLSFLLATKFKGRHWAIIAGIFGATVANHFVAAFLGDWVAANVSQDVMRWILGIAFLGFAAWALIPDKLDDADKPSRFGPFVTTLVAFFLAEMGDKTQFATIALGAKYASLTMVVLGTTLGMMAANIPAVLLGERLAQYIPLSKMRFIAAALFAAFGVLILLNVNIGLGFTWTGWGRTLSAPPGARYEPLSLPSRGGVSSSGVATDGGATLRAATRARPQLNSLAGHCA